MKVLLTGGAGYIGSHTFVALRTAGFEPVIVDASYHPSLRGSERPQDPYAIDRAATATSPSYADPALDAKLLGWHAEQDLARMCIDAWR